MGCALDPTGGPALLVASVSDPDVAFGIASRVGCELDPWGRGPAFPAASMSDPVVAFGIAPCTGCELDPCGRGPALALA